MMYSTEETKAILALPSALKQIAELIEEQTKVTRRLARRQSRAAQRFLGTKDVAREFGWSRSQIWNMPELMEEAFYPSGTSTPRWTREGVDKAVARMPRQPKTTGRRGVRDAA
jgi:hypothetical protein